MRLPHDPEVGPGRGGLREEKEKMKKWLTALLAGLLLLPWAFAGAEEQETAGFHGESFPVASEYIDLGKTAVPNGEYGEFYAFLSRFPNLKKVDMYATVIKRSRIGELTERFPGVEFGWTMDVGGHPLRTDAVSFTTAHSDRSRRHGTEEFSVLKYCKNLAALDLGHNAVDDLTFLKDLPGLKILILVDNQFQDITPVASLTELEYLELFYNDIRDVSALAGLTKLKDLNLGFNRIADISPLASMTWLERLWIPQYNSHNPNKRPDQEAVRKLTEALPDTLVDATAKSSVGNYWRDHIHYVNMRRVFKENVWIPLDTPVEP